MRQSAGEEGGVVGELTELLDNTLRSARFDAGASGTLDPPQLRQLYLSGGNVATYVLHAAALLVNESVLQALTERVRSVLGDHIIADEDSIPNKLAVLMGGVTKLTVAQFTTRLVRAAAILGSSRAAQMVLEWAEGRPMRYWRHTVLGGVSVEQPLDLNPSLRLANLPNSTDQVSRYLPSSILGFSGELAFLGRARMSIEYEVTFLSSALGVGQVFVDYERISLGVDNYDGDAFCASLALACNHPVSSLVEWSDCGDWNVFEMNSGVSQMSGVAHSSAQQISRESLREALDLYPLVRPQMETTKRLNTAITRWMQSKRGGATDRFIDLRIALEALYLRGASGESRFRVANHGAWHLGEDLRERQTYQKVLLDAYSRASDVVHAREVRYTEEAEALLNDAQDLCRKAILKRLQESSEPNWNDLILGSGA